MSNFFQTSFCFEPDSLSGQEIASLIEETISFIPTRIRSNEFLKYGGKFKPEHIKRIAKSKDLYNLDLETDLGQEGPYFHLAFLGSWNMQALYWKHSLADSPPLNTLNLLTSKQGFNVGYKGNADDIFWQSEDLISTYKAFSKPYKHLPLVYNEIFNRYDIDISKNYGRRTIFPGMWLQASWQMWFGQGAFRYIPKERLLAFNQGYIVSELPSGSVFIQLYEDGKEYEKKENRDRQKAFREWVGMDHLENQACEYVVGKGDIAFEIEEGAYFHGGVRMLTIWADKDGKPTRKSKAYKKIEIELNKNGQEVWRQEEIKLK
jgi:hypothetical protein